MGIFDAVIGEKDTGGALFSSTSAFAASRPAAPPPATAHLAALRAGSGRGPARGPARGARAGPDARDSDSASGDDSEDDDPARAKKRSKRSSRADASASAARQRREERASVEEAYEAAAAVLQGGGRGSRGSDDEPDDANDALPRKSALPSKAPSSSSKAPSEKKTKTKKRPADDPSADPSDDAALERTLFLGNVPLTLKPKKIRSLVAPFGAVESVRLRSVPVAAEGKMPRGGKVITGALAAHATSAHAYVVFADARSVADAIAAINMKKIDGRHLVANAATRPSTRSKGRGVDEQSGGNDRTSLSGDVAYDHTRALFLGNLPYDADEEDVIAFFAECKEYKELKRAVEAVRVVRDRATNAGKGIAFVLFREAKHARTGLLLDGAKMKTKGGGGGPKATKGDDGDGGGDGGDDALAPRAVRVTRVKRSVDASSSRERDAERRARRSGGSGEGRASGEPTGAARRLKLDDWEGARSRRGGKRAKTAHEGGPGPGRSGAAGNKRASKAAAPRGGAKRPAVAARKAKAKAKAAGERARR